ncbi:hypothetical protein CVT24_007126 [Panaeolus cyanescens]|uniref:DUF6534 domain-containing protein n=1 Tax=Panaeolus cyanescens TaxID=181874 RepID=A0A409VJW4_9AGAR|nr:hypothetical protein CVT24_007126 [Panaeolus cyanescens]
MEPVDIHQTAGAIFIGGMVTMAVYGITTLQITGFGEPMETKDGTWSLFISVGANEKLNATQLFDRFIKKQFSKLKEVSLISAVPFGVSAIISDILIAVALCVLLGSKRIGFDDTNSIIDRLIIFAINRCILTSAIAIVETIVFSVLPNSFYSVAIDFVIGKLYANSLLAVLNSRATIRHNPEARSESTELSTSFNMASAVDKRERSQIQVRTRDAHRRNEDEESSKRDELDGDILGMSRLSVGSVPKTGRRLNEIE